MNVVDSSGWLEFFGRTENSGFFATAINDVDLLVVPTICVYEVFKHIALQLGEQEALRAVGVMSLGKMVDLNYQIALEAARISMDLRLSMADSIILAITYDNQATLWTQDEHLKNLPGVKYVEKKGH